MPNFQNPATSRTDRQRLDRAMPYRRNEQFEHLLQMREQRPDDFAALPPNLLIGLGLYESDKATHDQITGGTAA